MCSVVCCTRRSVGCFIEAILALIAFSAAACCSRALCAGSKDLPHLCVYLRVFNRKCLPHWGQAAIKHPACLHGRRYSLVSAGVPLGAPVDVPAPIFIDFPPPPGFFWGHDSQKILRVFIVRSGSKQSTSYLCPPWMDHSHHGSDRDFPIRDGEFPELQILSF